ncbi:hypothetical protein DPMN_018627 [Dreissena polymorpha]|uniref:Uncharacterized protein n=1 Tax=Dreissena polymorpha TaxID=45954 RepID=A0A9D4NFH8_DREPO|nr:hypothetical protein DPMN_005866 [Dreissena polymorpha]KAH3894470.1 hypothetical protein DPMN_018627 [Dreissena polymorpha]
MLTQKGSKDFVVNTKRSIHPWVVPQTQITPTIVNKVLKVNTSGFCYEHLALRAQKASH